MVAEELVDRYDRGQARPSTSASGGVLDSGGGFRGLSHSEGAKLAFSFLDSRLVTNGTSGGDLLPGVGTNPGGRGRPHVNASKPRELARDRSPQSSSVVCSPLVPACRRGHAAPDRRRS